MQVGARVHQECKWMLGCSEGRWMPGCSGDATGVQESARAQKGCWRCSRGAGGCQGAAEDVGGAPRCSGGMLQGCSKVQGAARPVRCSGGFRPRRATSAQRPRLYPTPPGSSIPRARTVRERRSQLLVEPRLAAGLEVADDDAELPDVLHELLQVLLQVVELLRHGRGRSERLPPRRFRLPAGPYDFRFLCGRGLSVGGVSKVMELS